MRARNFSQTTRSLTKRGWDEKSGGMKIIVLRVSKGRHSMRSMMIYCIVGR